MFQKMWTKWGVLLASGAIIGTGIGGCVANLIRDFSVLWMVN